MLLTTIMETPTMDTESPFIIKCKAMVHGDSMVLNFIGDYARALQHTIKSLRTGDVASIGGKVRGCDILIESFTLITKETSGRNLNVWG